YLIETDKLENSLLQPILSNKEAWTSQRLLNDISLGEGNTTTSLQEILNNIITGNVFIYVEDEENIVYYMLDKKEKRSLAKAETESVIVGPQLAFTESLNTNLNIIRQIIPSTDLVLEKIIVGNRIS